MSLDLDVVIPTRDSGEVLGRCLASFRTYAPGSRLTVVDNDSRDDTVQIASDLADRVIQLGANRGYAAALAAGSEGTREFLIGCNPDIELRTGIAPLFAALERPFDVSGPMLFSEAGIQFACARRLPSLAVVLVDAMHLPRAAISALRLPDLYLSAWSHDDARDVPALSGAFFCIRRRDWLALGGMSVDGFMYFEDIDFFRRVARAGGRSRYRPEVRVFHIGAGSSATTEREPLVRMMLGATLLFAHREGRRVHLWRAVLAFGQLLRMAATMAHRDWPRAREYLARARWLWTVSAEDLTNPAPPARKA